MYLWPVGITGELIDTIARSEKCAHYLDIPIQHADDAILKAMRRPDNASRLRALIERLRAAMPDIILRTTVIVGFPGETDAQFERLLDFVRWARFDALGCFAYCREQGTPAAALEGQIPEQVKNERVERLMLAQQEIAFDKNASLVGSRLVCLVDRVEEDGVRIGRYYGQAPEIDSICIVEGCLARPGQFVTVKVTGSRGYDLLARAT
ncbi:MAG TPA: radical SAM protein [Phycisphaerales bacterium]|nr:radical SAM protein [Phycisphaerales bacterium]